MARLFLTPMAYGAPKPAPTVREMEIDGDITLFHTETQEALVLNPTAGDVWRLLDGERDVSQIVELLSRAYAEDAETVRAGVEAALAQFRQHDVLESAE
jgi:hypothetical protein